MNIYIDIDGVLLKESPLNEAGEPVPGVEKFLKQVTSKYDCYWLTTHCMDGDLEHLLGYLKRKLPETCIPYIAKIRPTRWKLLKTEAIDFNQEFRWYDDYVMEAEIMVLRKNNCLDSLIMIKNCKLPIN